MKFSFKFENFHMELFTSLSVLILIHLKLRTQADVTSVRYRGKALRAFRPILTALSETKSERIKESGV